MLSLPWGLTRAQQSMNVELLGRWDDTLIMPNFIDQRYNEIWGYATGNREYAIIGSVLGIHFIDVTDTADIHEVDFVAGRYQGDVIHRDFKNYRNYLYVACDEGPSSFQIVDMQYLPDSVHVVYDDASLVIRSHNVWLDTSSQRLYCLAVHTGDGGFKSMTMYSIADPELPVYLAEYMNAGISHVHDAYVRNDTAWLNCGFDGFYYEYFADPQNPVHLGSLQFYPDQGYNHSGWLTPDGSYYVMADETHGMRMKMIEMTPGPNQLSFHDLFNSGGNQYSIPHNQIIRDQYVYVSHYHDGLQIFDISDPDNVIQAGYYDTYPGPATDTGNASYAGAWGVYPLLPSGKILVSDMQTGLWVFQTPFTSVGIEEEASLQSSVLYPNPTSGWITIKGQESPDAVEVMDMNGKLVKQISPVTGNQFSIGELAPGAYQVTLKYGNARKTLKVVKK